MDINSARLAQSQELDAMMQADEDGNNPTLNATDRKRSQAV